MLTLYSIGVFVLLLIINLAFAGISHHIKSVTPLWLLAMALNKISAIAIPICIAIDIIGIF